MAQIAQKKKKVRSQITQRRRVASQPAVPVAMPGRHLCVTAQVKGKAIKVLSTRVLESGLVRSPIATGPLIAQIYAKQKVLWLDSFNVDGREYGVSRPRERNHSERRTSHGTLISLRIPITKDTLPKDLSIQLFASSKTAPRDLGSLDDLLTTPRSRPRALQVQGKVTLKQIAKDELFQRTLSKSHVRVPGLLLPKLKPKPLPNSLKQLHRSPLRKKK